MRFSGQTKLLVFMGFLALLLYFAYDNVSQIHERSLLEQNVPKDLEVDDLTTADLRLFHFVNEIKVDPPFSLSAANLEHLDQVISELELDKQNIKALFIEIDDQEAIEQYMFPIKFLQLLSKTENSRRDLIQNPSIELASTYLRNLSLTLVEYETYISTIQSRFNQSDEFPVGFIDGYVKKTNLERWLRDLISASTVAKNWIDRKEVCLETYSRDCQWVAERYTFTEQTAASTTSPNVETQAFVDYFVAHENRNTTGILELSATNTEPIFLYQGQCTSDKKAQHVRLWWNNVGEQKLPYTRLVYVDNLLFFDHVANAYYFSELMINNGVPYQFQPINHYLCHQHATDQSQLTAAYAVWEHMQTKHSPDTEPDGPLKKLHELERKINHSTTSVSVNDVIVYMNEVSSLLADHEISQKLPASVREELQTLLLAYRDRSTHFVDRLNALNKIIDPLIDSYVAAAVPNTFHMLLIHSALPMTLQSQNQTVVESITSPVSAYKPPSKYPHIIVGLDELKNQEHIIADPLTYFEHVMNVLDRVQKGEI